jgi:hypothetical protein
MHRLFILSAFLLSAVFLIPLATADDRRDKRYYDRQTRDYHVYNNQEDRAYRMYLGENHREYRDFRRMNRRQQQDYFRWRHNHSDQTLFRLEIR